MFKQNLTKLFNQANPSDIEQGLNWYREARVYAFELSKKHDVPFIKVCGVIAALSPRNRWERNKIDAERVIIAVKNNKRFMPRCGTYKTFRTKAVNILKLDIANAHSVLKVLNGPKISAFFQNIYDGENRNVTVDSWIFLAAKGKYQKEKDRSALKITEYREIANHIVELSNKNNLLPYQTQAILWVTFKRKCEAA